MNTRQSWGRTLKSQQQNILMQSFISTVTTNEYSQKDSFSRQLSEIDKRLSRMHAHQYYDPNLVTNQIALQLMQSSQLTVPKSNTLTDALLRTTLGCDEKYAKSYLQILDQTTVTQDKQKQKRIQQVKKKFAQSNSHIDFCANSKPYSPFQPKKNLRPVVDNEHQAYLKTQLIFLQKPKGGNITEKQYYDKHYDLITKKIEQLGGMEDTLGRMEDSLSQNQVKSFKRREILEQLSSSPRRNPFQLVKKSSQTQSFNGQSWIQRSKSMREGFKNKMHIS